MPITKRRGGDIVSAAISKIPTELHLHTLSGKKYNYCGPNTNLRKRLNPDKTPKDFSKPVNKVDKICMIFVGDRVRIYRYKRTFEKGYKPNWTKEIFVVDEVNKTIPITYKIKDLEGEPILGSFYKKELSKTKF